MDEKKLGKDASSIDGLEMEPGVIAACAYSPTDRLGALAKAERLLQMTEYFRGRMGWLSHIALAEPALPRQDVIDQVNEHLKTMLQSAFEAWKVTAPYEPKILPPEMQPKERPPLFPA